MTRILLLSLLVVASCRDSLNVVLPDRLAEGVGSDETELVARPQLDVVVRMSFDSTGFNPFDLMQLRVNGTDEADFMVIGGNWAVYTIPDPGSATFDLELTRRTGDNIDRGTIITSPYSGPLLDSVTPDTAQIGSQVTLQGSGFTGGVVRVFFGSAEATVDSSDDTTIVATIPDDALPGLVWVLIDDEAAEGVRGFQPLDLAGDPILSQEKKRIDALFPYAGRREAVIRVYGIRFDNDHVSVINGNNSQRILNVRTINVPPIGDIRMCFAVPSRNTQGGNVEFKLESESSSTNKLPFIVLE